MEKLKLPVSIYKKGNKYITVVGPFSSRIEALGFLPDIKKKVNSTAYLLDLNSWCPDVKMRDGYLECGGWEQSENLSF